MLSAAFPRQPVTPETVKAYLANLEDVPPPALEQAVRRLIRTGTFFPLISEIRAAVAEQKLLFPTEAEALAQVYGRIRWQRETEGEGEPPPVHPLVKSALDLVGGYAALRAADEPGVIRGQFLRLYREMRSSGLQEAQIGALALPPPPERKALS